MVDGELLEVLKGCEEVLRDRLSRSSSAESFLTDFKDLVESMLSARPTSSNSTEWSGEYYAAVVEELRALGLHRLHDVDTDFEEVTLQIIDAGSRRHLLPITIPRPGELRHLTVRMDLPGRTGPAKIPVSRTGGRLGLAEVVQAFEKTLEEFQPLWDQLDDLDVNTWIVEPDQPRRSHTYRRIALGNNLYLQIDIDPTSPLAPPAYKFLGADRAAAKCRETARKNIGAWDATNLLRKNIESLLEMTLPSRPMTDASQRSALGSHEMEGKECGICYSRQLPIDLGGDIDGEVNGSGAVPDQVCRNGSCGKLFHHRCLYEWLRSVPATRVVFGAWHGSCPYCSAVITTTKP
ncbi:hypothetical protein M427DRAFT_493993 [Gonapodya prolifera JEL478]|uniref:RING-type domain-containing protein n=1 Tax=Gonapodya prolifera (strain JEL478) TaxID=1344416 RepID=A0A139AZ05_GONPJ|nr:hypothetical protein M427DRAFT_493993 [Gonapodya prolifera JEL478]|eukprot:KXS21705.1 hypothetical protein M427DRAFT_493993 [Gonapodya prolifera JEL478]